MCKNDWMKLSRRVRARILDLKSDKLILPRGQACVTPDSPLIGVSGISVRFFISNIGLTSEQGETTSSFERLDSILAFTATKTHKNTTVAEQKWSLRPMFVVRRQSQNVSKGWFSQVWYAHRHTRAGQHRPAQDLKRDCSWGQTPHPVHLPSPAPTRSSSAAISAAVLQLRSSRLDAARSGMSRSAPRSVTRPRQNNTLSIQIYSSSPSSLFNYIISTSRHHR